MSNSTEQFTRDLLHSGIVSEVDFRKALDGTPKSVESVCEETLCNRLISHGLLTSYQAKALRAGKLSELVFGNYLVLDKLGTGGMGTVYKAKHRRMKRVVAIKVLSRERTKSPEMVERFQQEVETAAQLSHPNIVAAYDADECELGHFLVMEYVAGSDLAVLLHKRGPLPVREAVDYVMQTARALEFAHAQHIIHRDIKPANLLRTTDGTVKVTDMGLAEFKRAVEPGTEHTSSSSGQRLVVGTVDYMPPEQAFAPDTVDHRADIYSLACTLFNLLTAENTYLGETLMAKLKAHRDQPVRSLRELRADVPAELDAVYRRMAAKKAADRYPSMTEVIAALEECELTNTTELPDLSATTEFVLPSDSADAEPAAADSETTDSATADSAPTSCHVGSSMTFTDLSVILVESSRLQCRMIGEQLKALGVERLQTANSGAAALELMLASRPELVISSMHLPDMTGADLVQKMRGQVELNEIAFVLISSETDHQFLEPVRQSGTAAILPKPFELAALKRALTVAADFFSPGALRAHNLNLAAVRALIVDDSRSARRHVRRVLENLGITSIVDAAGGQEAIEQLAQQPFQLVVTDYNMPEIDGPALVRHIRADQTHQAMPVLMITSETDPALLDTARTAGVSAICNKIFDPRTVCEILEKILAKRG